MPPATMTTSDLEDVVFGLFPRKVITEKGDGAEIIQELRAFWHFLEHVYHLPQARQMLARLTPRATRRLEAELENPSNFGMAKSFVLMGKQAGFDMESPEGMQAWVQKPTMPPWHPGRRQPPGIWGLRPERSRVRGSEPRAVHQLVRRNAHRLGERRGHVGSLIWPPTP